MGYWVWAAAYTQYPISNIPQIGKEVDLSVFTLGVILALSSSVSYGSADFFGGLGSRRISPYQVLALSEAVGAISMALLAVLSGESFPSWLTIFWCCLGNLIGVVGLAMLYQGLATGNTAVVAPVAGVVGAAVPVLLAFFTSGFPELGALIGFALAVPAIGFVTASGGAKVQSGNSGLRLAVLSGLAFGFFYVVMGQVKTGGVFGALSIGRILALVVMLGILRLRREPFVNPLKNFAAVVTGVLDSVGNATYMLANQNLRLDVAVILTSIYPAVTVLLSAFVLKEKVRLLQWIGVGMCVAAIILIAL